MRLLIGTTNPLILEYGAMIMRVSAALFLPLAFLLVTRQAMQSMGMHIAPVVSSSMELTIKVTAAYWVVPRFGVAGVSWVEPSSWVVCCAFLSVVYLVQRRRVLHMDESGGRT